MLEPVGQPAFGPGGQLFFQARNRSWPRDRNGRIPVGLFRYRQGDAVPVGMAVLDQAVPGQAGQRLLDVPQRPVVSAKAVAFPALFGGNDRFPVPSAGLFRVPLDSTLDKDGILVVAEGDELSFPAQVVGFRDFYYTADGTLIFDTTVRRWLVVGQLVASLTSGASTASVVRTQAASPGMPTPLLTKGDDLGSGRKLQQVLGRLVPIGPSRDLFAAQFSQGSGAGEGLFTVDRSKQIQPVAVTEAPAAGPGLSGARFIGFSDTPAYTLDPPSVSADGNVVFKALLERAGVTTFGVFQWMSGAATAVGVTDPDPDPLKHPDLLKIAPDDRPPYRLDRWAAGTSGHAYFLEQHQTTFDAPVARLFGRSDAGPVPLVVPGKTLVGGEPGAARPRVRLCGHP
jgi:hypothetical protein